METNRCLCVDVAYQNGHSLPESISKPKSPSIERCMKSEFRERSNTSPSELRDKVRSRPRMRLARDPEQPSSGSLTRQPRSDVTEHIIRSEEEDSVTPMMRPRSNTCPEKRALQMVRRRIRNRPPTPPPGDVANPGSLQGSPRERASSLNHSRECLLDTSVAEDPEVFEQRDTKPKHHPEDFVPPNCKLGKLNPDRVCKELHRLKLTENNNMTDCSSNPVSINVTDGDEADPNLRFTESGGTLTASNCRRNAKEIKIIAANARLSFP